MNPLLTEMQRCHECGADCESAHILCPRCEALERLPEELHARLRFARWAVDQGKITDRR